MRKVFVRTPYNYDMAKVSRETAFDTGPDSVAQQSFKDECDINNIVRRFKLTGEMPQGVVPPTYQTFDGIFDYQTAMNAIRQAQESFEAMPAEIRAKFHNDPQAFVEFCSDEKNLDEMRSMGLAIPAENNDNTPAPSGSGNGGSNVGSTETGAAGGAKASGGSGEAGKGV